MSLPIKPTPILRGKAAIEFHCAIEENLKKDHTESWTKVKASYESMHESFRRLM